MNVDPFERLTTSVWTFRFPWRVGFAFGIRDASSLRASASGFSTTLFASGSRKSILATRRSLSRLCGHQPVLHNAGMTPDSVAARRDQAIVRLRRIRVWLLLIVGGVAVALLPWSAYLSATLPSEHLANHWDVAWAGLDLFEAAALVFLFLAVVRRSVLVPIYAAV